MRRQEGDFGLLDGTLDGAAVLLDADEPALVSLRAAPRALDLLAEDRRVPAAALALPIVNRNELLGVVLAGGKPEARRTAPTKSSRWAGPRRKSGWT